MVTGVSSVVSPVGEHPGKAAGIAPRLPDLNGKTICEVWNGGFRADTTFPLIRELLEKRYPKLKVIPYTEMPAVTPFGDVDKMCTELREALSQEGADAVISGNGG